jgi:hypothetical protein
VRVKVVVRVNPPPVAVTVTGELPMGVEAEAVMVMVVGHVGVQEVGLNVAVVPVGSPETENETAWVVPDTKLAVIVFVTEDP